MKINRRDLQRIVLLATLLLAAWLRWHVLDQVDYSYDEAHITGMAQGVADLNGYLPLLSGGTSLGVPRGALDVYLLALPLLITGGRIEAAVWMVGALGLLAIALTYVLSCKIGKVFWHTSPSPGNLAFAKTNVAASLFSLFATSYMAFNPWLVYFDRRLWAHIQVVLSVALFLLAWQVVVERNRRSLFWFPILAVAQIYCHVLALVQALSWFAAVLVAPRRWLRRGLALGLFLALLLLAPYLFALLQRLQEHNFEVASPLLQLSQAANQGSTQGSFLAQNPFFSNSWLFAWQLFSGTGFSSVIGQSETANFWWQWSRWAAPLLVGLFVLLGLITLCYRAFFAAAQSDGMRLGSRLLLLWALGPLLTFTIKPDAVFLQYWTVLLPLPALVWGVGLVTGLELLAGQRLKLRTATVLPVLVSVLTFLLWTGSYLRVQDSFTPGAGRTTLALWQGALAQVRHFAEEAGTQEVRVAVNGVDPGYDADPAVIATLIGNPPFARFVAPTTPPSLLFSADRPSLYFWKISDPATEQLLSTVGERIWQGDPQKAEMDVRIYRLPPFAQSNLSYQSLSPIVTFDAGMQLIGYQFSQNAHSDQPFQVTMIWQVLEPSMEVRQRDMTAFNHILDGNGGMAGQIDGLALLSRDWWPGDVLLQSYEMQLPAGEYHWRTGLYSHVDGGRSITDSGMDFVDLPTFVVQE